MRVSIGKTVKKLEAEMLDSWEHIFLDSQTASQITRLFTPKCLFARPQTVKSFCPLHTTEIAFMHDTAFELSNSRLGLCLHWHDQMVVLSRAHSSELSTHRRRLSPGHDITNGAVANFR